MDSKGPDKQADRPVRSSGPMRGPSTACEWCSGPADGVLDFMHLNDRGRRLRLCMECQRRHVDDVQARLRNRPHASALSPPAPSAAQPPNPGVPPQEPAPAIGTCVVCGKAITLHWYFVSTQLGERVTGMCCSLACVRSVERR